jgi:plastocyanin
MIHVTLFGIATLGMAMAGFAAGAIAAEAPDGTFASAPFGKGKSFAATFDTPGEYAYFCSKHKSMHGTVKVLPVE